MTWPLHHFRSPAAASFESSGLRATTICHAPYSSNVKRILGVPRKQGLSSTARRVMTQSQGSEQRRLLLSHSKVVVGNNPSGSQKILRNFGVKRELHAEDYEATNKICS